MVFVRSMFSRKAEGPMDVRVPSASEDHPNWTRIGVIAAVGFVVGVAWPRVVGVKLGPSVPEQASAAAASSASGAPPADVAALPAAVSANVPAVVAAPPAPPASAAAAAPSANVSVGHAVVFACKTADGESLKGSDCGALPGLDAMMMTRLRKLAECPEAAGAAGKLHLIAHVDFSRGLLSVDLGRGSSVSSPEALVACARADMAGAAIAGVPHENPRYSVAFTATFASGAAANAEPAAPSARAAASSDASEATAQVAWDVAIVRDAPKTGKVIARLQRGAQVRIGAVKEGWYPVKFGEGFAGDGWLYRGAIGR